MDQSSHRVVERQLLFTPPANCDYPAVPLPGDRGIVVTLAIALPLSPDPSVCTLFFDGFVEPRKTSGVDKWQALFLALRTLHQTLSRLAESGWTFEIYEYGCEKVGVEPDCIVTVGDIMSGLTP